MSGETLALCKTNDVMSGPRKTSGETPGLRKANDVTSGKARDRGRNRIVHPVHPIPGGIGLLKTEECVHEDVF